MYLFLRFYLDKHEVDDAVYAPVVGESEEHGEDPRHEHAHREEEPEVHPLGHQPTDEHEEGVGEEVCRVQGPLQALAILLTGAVDLGWEGIYYFFSTIQLIAFL